MRKKEITSSQVKSLESTRRAIALRQFVTILIHSRGSNVPKFGLQGRNCYTACHCYGTTVHRSVGDCLLSVGQLSIDCYCN